jgi:hypothetical protein
MLGNIFNKEDEEKRQMSEGMQSMSNQIGELSKQLAEKNAKIEELQKNSGNAQASATALADAKKEMDSLHQQLRDMQRKFAEQQAAQEAEKMAADLIKQQQEKAKQTQGAGVSIGASSTPAAAASTSGLSVGGSAWVTREGGLPLRLRSGAGLNHDVLDRLQPGTQMTLVEGPRQADNYSWWHIRTTDGREGWVAGQDLRAQPD